MCLRRRQAISIGRFLAIGLIASAFVYFERSGKAGPVTDEGEIESLVLLINEQIRGNLDQIRTLEATYSYTDVAVLTGDYAKMIVSKSDAKDASSVVSLQQEESGLIRFVYDREKDSYFSACESEFPPQFRLAGTGKVIAVSGISANQYQAVVTPDEVLFFQPNLSHAQIPAHRVEGLKGGVGRIAFREEHKVLRDRHWTDIPDPKMLYGFDNPLDKWVGALAAVYRSGSSDEREKARRFLVVNRDDTPGGVVVNVSIRTGRALGVTFEEGAGFHATRFTLADSKGDPAIMQTLNFDRIDGIYVPRRIERTTYRGSSDLLSRRVMELKSCYFNRPIQANAFTWTALDLKTGDRIYNKAAKELSVVQDGVLVSPADYRGEQDTLVEKGESVRHWRLFVVAAAIVCGVIAVALIGSKSRRLRMR